MKRSGLCVASLSLTLILVSPGYAEEELVADERPALPFPPGLQPESICGTTDELQDVELYDGTLGVSKGYVTTHQPSTVQLQWVDAATMLQSLPGHAIGNVAGARWCTGTLVDTDLVLTAGHCFDVQKGGSTGWFSPFRLVNGAAVYVEPPELAKLLRVNFLYQIDGTTNQVRQAISYPVVELVEYRRSGLDYAFVRVGPDALGALPGARFSVAGVAPRAPVDGETLGILQHPQGWPKKIEVGHMLKVLGAVAWYDDIDTYGGSSGSGVRDQDGTVIAVHTNGGCNTDGGNKGVTAHAIAQVSDEL